MHWKLWPLFEKGSVYDLSRYRGIHLSCILSKVIESVIGNLLIIFLQAGDFGDAPLTAEPIQLVRTLSCMEGWWEEGACMHEAARPLIAIRGGSGTRQTLKPSHLMHAYVQDPGFLNLRTGRADSKSGFVTHESSKIVFTIIT